jgi:hypothetical protein
VGPEGAPHSSRLTWLAVYFGAGACALLAGIGADARWLAALGREIVERGAIPDGVPYAAAPSVDWVNVPVLGELIFHGLQVVGGDHAFVLAQLAAVTLALVLLVLDMRARRVPDAAGAVVILAVFFAAAPAIIIVRAQLFSLVFFCATLFLLRSEMRAPSRRIWLLVPMVAVWANLHGAALVGLAVAASYLLLERLRQQPLVVLGVLTSSVAALFLTPALLDSGDYYLGVLRSEAALRGEGMWAPLSPNAPFDVLFVLLAVPLVVFAVRSCLRPWELACVASFATMTLHAGRNSVWLIFFIAAPAAAGLGRARLATFSLAPRRELIVSVVPAALFVAGVLHTPPPDGAGERVRRQAAALAAGTPILADGIDAERLALDGQRVWIANPLDAFAACDQRLYLDWLDARPEGDTILHQSGAVVLVTRGSAAQERLSRDRQFRPVAHDKRAVVYLRVRPASTRRS